MGKLRLLGLLSPVGQKRKLRPRALHRRGIRGETLERNSETQATAQSEVFRDRDQMGHPAKGAKGRSSERKLRHREGSTSRQARLSLVKTEEAYVMGQGAEMGWTGN